MVEAERPCRIRAWRGLPRPPSGAPARITGTHVRNHRHQDCSHERVNNALTPDACYEPDRVADDLGREAVAGVGRLGGWRHAGPVAAFPPPGNPTRPNLTVPLPYPLFPP